MTAQERLDDSDLPGQCFSMTTACHPLLQRGLAAPLLANIAHGSAAIEDRLLSWRIYEEDRVGLAGSCCIRKCPRARADGQAGGAGSTGVFCPAVSHQV